MNIKIWSDIMCPFCYIGKRRFEKALAHFEHRDQVEVTWKSFLLNPAIKTEPGKNINEYLAAVKGWTVQEAQAKNDRVTQMALLEGLTYDFDRVVVANAVDAHRVIQFAKQMGLADAMEEQLFNAYFTQGKNIADHAVLTQLGGEAGLPQDKISVLLKSNAYKEELDMDIQEAYAIGVRAVPFFLLIDTYVVSGAQSTPTFLDALNRSWETWAGNNAIRHRDHVPGQT